MDQIVLVLMVAAVGSLLIPAMRLARLVERGHTPTPYHRVSSTRSESETGTRLRVPPTTARRGTVGENEEWIAHNPSENFVFRPLTEEEKTEFMNSLDAKASQLLAELAGKATGSRDSEPANTNSSMVGDSEPENTTAPYRVLVNRRDRLVAAIARLDAQIT